jgi:nucleoside-diphosphate-sugar epimerase
MWCVNQLTPDPAGTFHWSIRGWFAARNHYVRSCAAIANKQPITQAREGDAETYLERCSPYAAAKFAASAYGRMFHALYHTPVTILRLFMVYGPGQQDLRKLVPYVTLALLKGQTPELSSGVRKVDWIYVDDVVAGYLAAATATGVEGSTIDLGSGRLDTVRTVVEELVGLINPRVQPLFGSIPERALEQTRTADVERSFRRIGWRTQVNLHDGLARTVDWYRDRMALGLV